MAHHGLSQWNGVASASRVGLDDVSRGFPDVPHWGEPAVAAARDSPARFGTGRRSGPRETTASIWPPSTIFAPGPGWVEMTAPRGTDSL